MGEDFDAPFGQDSSTPAYDTLSEIERDELDALSTLAPSGTDSEVYTGWSSEPLDVITNEGITGDDDAYIYGLGFDKPMGDGELRDHRREGLSLPMYAAVIVLALGLLGGVAVWRIGTLAQEEQQVAVIAEKRANEEEPVEEEEAALGAADIKTLVGSSLAYGQDNVSLDAAQVSVEVRDGKVLVTHTLPEKSGIVPKYAVRMAGIRANVLASLLKDKKVAAEGEEGQACKEVVWVLRNAAHEAYLAISEVPGDVRTSSGDFGVISGAHGYALSKSIHEALGEGAGIAASAGTKPTDLAGKEIAVTATVPVEETTQEQQAEEATGTDDTGYAGDQYYEQSYETNYNGGANQHQQSNQNSGNAGGQTDTGGDAGGTGGDAGGGETPGDAGGDSGEGGDAGGESGGDGGGSSETGGETSGQDGGE